MQLAISFSDKYPNFSPDRILGTDTEFFADFSDQISKCWHESGVCPQNSVHGVSDA
jgi:hypothetical protein